MKISLPATKDNKVRFNILQATAPSSYQHLSRELDLSIIQLLFLYLSPPVFVKHHLRKCKFAILHKQLTSAEQVIFTDHTSKHHRSLNILTSRECSNFIIFANLFR